jgi:hypothetical protein
MLSCQVTRQGNDIAVEITVENEPNDIHIEVADAAVNRVMRCYGQCVFAEWDREGDEDIWYSKSMWTVPNYALEPIRDALRGEMEVWNVSCSVNI